jgi:predicted MFS family arabinose efflux permease
MNYGVFQDYYANHWILSGSQSLTGVIGTTSNGVLYLSMPILFTLFSRRWARHRQLAIIVGTALTSLSFLVSSFSTHVWHLVATQGVLASLGSSIIYSTTTLSLGEWYQTNHRALAYGMCLSAKGVVGSVCPFLFRYLLDRYGFRTTLRIWTGVFTATSIAVYFLMIPSPLSMSLDPNRRRRIPWHFLKHPTFWIHTSGILLQSSGYAIPQTYLNSYAHDVSLLPETTSTLLLTLFNVPGIIASFVFGYILDNKHFKLASTTLGAISAIFSSLSVFLLWGLTSIHSLALLIMFAATFGFFAGGYSSIWGGFVNDLEGQAARHDEAIDPGIVYGLMNGARGLGYLCGGLASVPLFKAGQISTSTFGYGSTYAALIVFTGSTVLLGGWGSLWKNMAR